MQGLRKRECFSVCFQRQGDVPFYSQSPCDRPEGKGDTFSVLFLTVKLQRFSEQRSTSFPIAPASARKAPTCICIRDSFGIPDPPGFCYYFYICLFCFDKITGHAADVSDGEKARDNSLGIL